MRTEPEGGDSTEARVFTLFGMDIYLISFLAIGGTCVLFAIYYLFFTDLPMPRYCGVSRAGGSRICGYTSRAPEPPSPARHP